MTELTAADVINAVPGIETKNYLELGVAGRATYDNVRAMARTGVDILGGEDLHAMATDRFFQISAESLGPFDVIYIDADHTYPQAVKDYNNAIKHLRPGGLILLHDMWPPNEEYTKPIWCGDAFKLLVGILRGKAAIDWHADKPKLTMMVLDHNYGLTAVFDPQPVDPDGDWANITYEEFASMGIHRSTADEVLSFVQRGGL